MWVVYLLQIDAMVDIVRSDVHLDVGEVAVQGPHSAVVGPRRVQCDNTAGGSVSADAVQHGSTAGVSKVHWQIQLLACLHAWHGSVNVLEGVIILVTPPEAASGYRGSL